MYDTATDQDKKIIIAIDGYSACGKSSTAKEVASRLGFTYVDSGAMYRAVTLYFLDHNVDLENQQQIAKALKEITITFKYNKAERRFETYLNGGNIEEDIRRMRVSNMVSKVSVIPEVRSAMVDLQRVMGKGGGVVMDGRDIGTTVYPDAELKVFMTANFEARVDRRMRELESNGVEITSDEIKENLATRDRIDSTREVSPLRKADDAHEIDTSYITFEQQVQKIIELARSRMKALSNA
ncbi:(d)CMP kinase [Roseivirga sp. BDSF3-8]|uniref:(d)CMP kinase n=1 Tax=Roseivirga sp. BDSF3-8 TaxID=3241598 RepID=UPI003532081B